MIYIYACNKVYMMRVYTCIYTYIRVPLSMHAYCISGLVASPWARNNEFRRGIKEEFKRGFVNEFSPGFASLASGEGSCFVSFTGE